MKKTVFLLPFIKTIFLIPFIGLGSTILNCCSEKTLVPSYAYVDDYFFLVNAGLIKRTDDHKYRSGFSYKEDGYLNATLLYSSLFAEEGWCANIYLNFFGLNGNSSFFYEFTDCCNANYQGSYNDDWFDFSGKPGQYTYMAHTITIFPDMIPASLFADKYSTVLLTLELIDKNSNLFESFSNYGTIKYDDDIVTIRFTKFSKIKL